MWAILCSITSAPNFCVTREIYILISGTGNFNLILKAPEVCIGFFSNPRFVWVELSKKQVDKVYTLALNCLLRTETSDKKYEDENSKNCTWCD